MSLSAIIIFYLTSTAFAKKDLPISHGPISQFHKIENLIQTFNNRHKQVSCIDESSHTSSEEAVVESIVSVDPETLEDSQTSCLIPGTTTGWRENCEMLLKGEYGVSKSAVQFALKTLRINSQKFVTNKCYKTGVEGHRSSLKEGEFEKKLEDGITNKCYFVISDLDEQIDTHNGLYKCKTALYYIDLCQTYGPFVHKTFNYLGYGTCKKKKGFLNEQGQGTSLLGAFVSQGNVFSYGDDDEKYDTVRSRLRKHKQKFVPATSLVGIQSTNNTAASSYKYLHVGAFTSAGCISVPPDDYWIVKNIGREPSVVVSYKKGMMENIDECKGEM